jgi:hypothetical protein
MQIDDLWKQHFGNQAVILLENCPIGLELGVDILSYDVADSSFHGFSHIPCDNKLRFIYFGFPNSPRDGFFCSFSSGEPNIIIVKRWSTENNSFETHEVPETAMPSLKATILSSYSSNNPMKFLPYPQDNISTWNNLSNFIVSYVIEDCGITVNEVFTSSDQNPFPLTAAEAKLFKKPSINTVSTFPTPKFPSFHEIENKYFEENHFTLTPSSIGNLKLEKSWLLQLYLNQKFHSQSSYLLGSFQLSFLLFLCLYSFESLQFWKESFELLSTCESYFKQNHHFCKYFLFIIYYHLTFIPMDFFEHEISKDSFLLPTLTSLFTSLNDISDPEINEMKIRLNKFIFQQFGYSVLSTDHQSEVAGDVVLEKEASESIAMEHDNFEGVEEGQGEGSEYISNINEPMDLMTKQELQFSWRYPLLFKAVKDSQGSEDFLMASVRIIDENQLKKEASGNDTTDEDLPLLIEAMKFVQEETKFL